MNIQPVAITCEHRGRPTVSSLELADRLRRRHSHILRDIEHLRPWLPREIFQACFGLMEKTVCVGPHIHKKKSYFLARDGLVLFLAAQQGRAVVQWIARYIEAFRLVLQL